MTNIKAWLTRLVKPSVLWLIPLTLTCAAALYYVFASGQSRTLAAYVVYALCTYALVAWCIRACYAGKHIKCAAYSHPLLSRYLTDIPYRVRTSVLISACIGAAFAVYKLILAVAYQSYWFGAVGIYYLLLSFIRALLARHMRSASPEQEWSISKRYGWLLLLLNTSLSGMVIQMVRDAKGYTYPGHMIFAVALYAFYAVISSIIGLVRYRKLGSPLLTTAKTLSVASALVAMLALQTAMFASFGGGAAFARLMNTLTGTAVCTVILGMAVALLLRPEKICHKNINLFCEWLFSRAKMCYTIVCMCPSQTMLEQEDTIDAIFKRSRRNGMREKGPRSRPRANPRRGSLGAKP